jgi:predicted nuclease of restriction endonuclease-like RecB superfamily
MYDKRCEASRQRRECLEDKINGLETNGMNKNIRGLYRVIHEFKKVHQPRELI